MIEESYGYEDDLINGVYVAYENIFVAESNSPIKYIECDNTGKLLAFVEYDGTISIWDYSNEEWKRQATWKYRGPRKPNYKPPKLNQQEPLVSTYRTDVIARWCGHGRYLGIASNVSRKVHLFGENTDPSQFESPEKAVTWHRKHTLVSASQITEMRFSPSHVEFTLVTATANGMVIIHMLQDKNNIKSWKPIHAISVFRNQAINSLSWNQNPVHELPILIASTDDLDASEGKQVAVFAINSSSVRAETNMCFDNIHQVSCVSFAPSSGLNDSLLAVAAGRKITLYLMNVEEFQVPEHFSPSIASESDDYQNNVEMGSGSLVGSSSAVSSSIEIDKMSNHPNALNQNNTGSSIDSDFSPLLPNNFFKNEETPVDEPDKRDSDPDSSYNSTSSEEEETEQEPSDSRKALMWNVKWVAVFRESCAVKRIQWGRNPDNFTAHLIDGRIQSYKWTFGCCWTRSIDLNLRGIQTNN